MNSKLLLIRAITLLYRQSQLDVGATSTPDLVKDIANTVQMPEMVVGSSDSDRDLLMGLKFMALTMAQDPEGTKYVAEDLLQKVRLFTVHDETLYETLKEGIVGNMEETDLRTITGSIRQELTEYLRNLKAMEIIKEASKKAMFKREEIGDMPKFIAEFRSALEIYETSVKEKDPAIVGAVSLSNIDQVVGIFNQAKELNDEKGIMKTGWQGLNRMLQGGFRRGEECVIGALQHNFKTGFSLSLFKHIAMYNTPYMIDPKKKPMLLRISFEDPLSLNFPFLYRNIKENETLQPADVVNTPEAEMAAYVMEKLSINGYEVRLLHVNPSLWGYRDIQNYVLQMEAEGFEIHCLFLDYLNMIDKSGCDNTGPMGSNIRDLFRRMRNFCSPRKITLITPHQLSTEAKMLIRQGNEENFVKEIANKGFYDSCKTLDQEVDLEIYIHIVKVDGKSWLTIQRGKHRLIKQTAEEFKFCVLPFEDIGDIRDDIGKADTTRKKPGGNPVGSTEPRAFWDFDEE